MASNQISFGSDVITQVGAFCCVQASFAHKATMEGAVRSLALSAV